MLLWNALAKAFRGSLRSRAREAAPISLSSEQTDLNRPAGRLRLLADVDISNCRHCCLQNWGQTMELGIGVDADVGFA